MVDWCVWLVLFMGWVIGIYWYGYDDDMFGLLLGIRGGRSMSNELVMMVNNNIEDMKNNEGLLLLFDYLVGNVLNSVYLILSDMFKG